MTKPALAIGVAIAAISLGVGLVGCGSKSKSPQPSPASTSTSTSTSTTSPSAQASRPNETLDEYLKKNNIQETPISHNTPGAPTVDLPVPAGWSQLPESDDAPYGALVFDTPTDPNDPPKIKALVEKLTGNFDTDQLLAASAGDLNNEPGYDGGDGVKSTLSGFPAYQLGGTLTKNGVKHAVAQKAAVIQGKDGSYLLLLVARAPHADRKTLMDATDVIDDKTTITP